MGHVQHLVFLLFQHGGGSDQLRRSADRVDDPPGTAVCQHLSGHVHCQEGQDGARQDIARQELPDCHRL